MPDNIRFDSSKETLIIPLADERMDFRILNYPFIKHYMLLIYEKFLWNQKPNFSTFTSVIFLNTTNGEIIQAWNDPTGNSIGGITQVLPINDKVFLFGTDMAPALFLLKL
uniref:Strictosidine synthase conserved region domain-containing protein n=1 Tax=Panagrolaimus sp. ES5 TaxID=591445 RepID=A0AC34FA38_9BILA